MTEEDWKLAEYISSNEDLIQTMILVKYGIPYDVAMCLDEATRFGYVCIVKQMYEQVWFDFNQKRWRQIEPPKVIAGKR